MEAEGRSMSEGKYGSCTDEELISLSRSGDSAATDFLMERYKGLVRGRARSLRLAGGDQDDLIQEGMLGLFKALRDYDPARGASFATFASLCVSRQMYTAVEASVRQKHQPLNEAVPYDQPAEIAAPTESDPEEQYISEESRRQLEQDIDRSLSPFEHQVLNLYLSGLDYTAIAARLGREPKSTDNALQRIKAKVRRML